MIRTVILLYKFFYVFSYFKNKFSFYKLVSIFKLIFFFKNKDTKYPSYLLEYENKISSLNNKKYTLSFSSGTQAFESLVKSLNVKNKKLGVCNIVFPSIFRQLTRYFNSQNLKILTCNKDLVLDLEKNLDEIKNLDYLLITFAYGYPYRKKIIDKIFSINSKINLIYDLSHSQGYSEKNNEKNMQIHYFFSTQGSKSISTGEGGIVSTDDLFIYKKMIFNSHLNRIDKKFNLSEKEKLGIKIGLLSKSRMSPLGAVSGVNDIFDLKKNNKLLQKKILIIYNQLSMIDDIYLPKIHDFKELTGFHYGVPFIINNELSDVQKNTLLWDIKKYFKITKYNWLSTSNLKKLKQEQNLEKFENYDFNFLDLDYANDKIFENLYFIDLNYLKIFPNIVIKSLSKKLLLLTGARDK
tara:strand:+ start:525 stop:1751 length:1227 start_codon:yes stop_codon:yes gene_type:complete